MFYSEIFHFRPSPVKHNQCFLAESACSMIEHNVLIVGWSCQIVFLLLLFLLLPKTLPAWSSWYPAEWSHVFQAWVNHTALSNMGWTKENRLIVREERRDGGGGWWEGGGQDGAAHVFEVALLLPIQMSRSTWWGKGEPSDGWREGKEAVRGENKHLCNRRQQQQ